MNISHPSRFFRRFALCCFAPAGITAVQAAATMVDLGTAEGFGVLAGTAITVTGPTTVFGDAGTSSGTAISGKETLILLGTDHSGSIVTQNAQTDLTAAFDSASLQTPDFTYPGVSDLGGLTLTPGVHFGSSSLAITGVMTLDAGGDPDAYWLFQVSTSLTTATDSSVVLLNGAKAGNILWQVGSSATLGTGSSLSGDILALTSITLTTGAQVDGGIYARNGAVTFDTNVVGIPEPMTGLLAILGLAMAGRGRKRRA